MSSALTLRLVPPESAGNLVEPSTEGAQRYSVAEYCHPAVPGVGRPVGAPCAFAAGGTIAARTTIAAPA